MKVLWLSANKLGLSVFPDLLAIPGITVAGIVTLSPASTTIMYDGVEADAWKSWGIPVHEVMRIGDEEDLIKKISPDCIFMCGWRQKVPPSLLSIIPQGVIGFHPTLLPVGRGPAPIINSILEGFTMSGVTMFYLADELDSGDIIGQESFSITDEDYAQDVYEKVTGCTGKLIKKYAPLLVKGIAPRIPQDHARATFFQKRTMADNEIDLSTDTGITVIRKIRAFSYPYRGAYIRMGEKNLVIWKASIGSASDEP